MAKLNCSNCNKFHFFNKKQAENKVHCCSHKCASDFKKNNRLLKSEDKCCICNITLKLKPFHKKRFKGPFCCSRSCRAQLLKTYYKGSLNPNFKYSNNLVKFLSNRVKDIKTRCSNKIKFDLDIDFMLQLYNNQMGLCFYTKIPMKLSTQNWYKKRQPDMDVLSVDRIIPNLGYTKNNVVLCCNSINKLKGNATIDEFKYFIKQLIKNNTSF